MVRESHSSSKKAKNSILIVVNDSIWKNQSFNSEPKHKIKFGKKYLRSPKFYSKIEQELSKKLSHPSETRNYKYPLVDYCGGVDNIRFSSAIFRLYWNFYDLNAVKHV